MTGATLIDRTADALCDELHRILQRLLHEPAPSERQPAQLRIEPEGPNWLVVDDANPDKYEDPAVMIRTDSIRTAIKFARAFTIKHPEAVLDELSVSLMLGRTVDAGFSVKASERPQLRLVQP